MAARAPGHRFCERLKELLRADASMKTIVRKGTGASYRVYLRRLAEQAGRENPAEEDARRMDRTRTGRWMGYACVEGCGEGRALLVSAVQGRLQITAGVGQRYRRGLITP